VSEAYAREGTARIRLWGASAREPLARFGAGMDSVAVEDKDSNTVERCSHA
jgi:hypothetical protein